MADAFMSRWDFPAKAIYREAGESYLDEESICHHSSEDLRHSLY